MLSIHTKLQYFPIVSLGLPKVSALQVFKTVYKIPKCVNIYYIYRWVLEYYSCAYILCGLRTMNTLQEFKSCLSMHESFNILCYTNPTQSTFKFEGFKLI